MTAQAIVRSGGYEIRGWTSYRIDSDLLTPASGWRMTLGLGGIDRAELEAQYSELLEALAEGSRVEVVLGTPDGSKRSTQLVGHIDTLSIRQRSAGTEIEIDGRDVGALLADSSAPLGLLRASSNFLEMVRLAVAPWDLEVIADATASRNVITGRAARAGRPVLDRQQATALGLDPAVYSRAAAARARRQQRALDEVIGTTLRARARRRRSNELLGPEVERLKVDQARPQPGETVWGFIDRHARRLGLLPWIAPTGELVLSAPDYDSPPVGRLVRRRVNDATDPNTITGGGLSKRGGAVFSEVTVYGRARGDVERSAVRYRLTDPTNPLPFRRALVVQDQSVRSETEAKRLAKRELNTRSAKQKTLSYSVARHGQGGTFWAVDSTADVVDEVARVEGRFYIIRRSLQWDERSGTTTSLQLVPRNAIQL